MKINKLLYKLGLPIFLLFNTSFLYSSQISNISIEGFKIGDSLIDFIDEEIHLTRGLIYLKKSKKNGYRPLNKRHKPYD